MTTVTVGSLDNQANASNHQGDANAACTKTSEQIMVDLIREDLGVHIEPQAWRMFVRQRWDRMHGPAHRIHQGKR